PWYSCPPSSASEHSAGQRHHPPPGSRACPSARQPEEAVRLRRTFFHPQAALIPGSHPSHQRCSTIFSSPLKNRTAERGRDESSACRLSAPEKSHLRALGSRHSDHPADLLHRGRHGDFRRGSDFATAALFRSASFR